MIVPATEAGVYCGMLPNHDDENPREQNCRRGPGEEKRRTP